MWCNGWDQPSDFFCLIQETTGSIRTKGTAEMPFKCSATWKRARPASQPTRPVSPARPGGPNPFPAPPNQCGTERTLAVAHWWVTSMRFKKTTWFTFDEMTKTSVQTTIFKWGADLVVSRALSSEHYLHLMTDVWSGSYPPTWLLR